MIDQFEFDLELYNNNRKDCYTLLAKFLNVGHVGLFLGAGASVALGLPGWEKLVKAICLIVWSDFDTSKSYDTVQLKELITQVKDEIDDTEKYLELVKKQLYEGVDFTFDLASKELLIALSSLIVGTQRGTVQNVVTLNFDSVFEWYLHNIGLAVNTLSKHQLLNRSADVNITHINGYLPEEKKYGRNSDFIIFSDEDFQDRMFSPYDYWKEHLIEFFRRHIFLSIGVSANSLIGDVRPYLTFLNEWYKIQKIERKKPYGIAFVSKDKTTPAQIKKLTKMGIITCTFEHKEVPNAIFEVVTTAAKLFGR